MKRFLFIATLVAMAANAWAYEYTFNFAQNYASRTVSGTTVKFTMPDNNGNPLITFEVITDANIANAVDRVVLTDDNRLVIPPKAKLRVRVSDGYYMRQFLLGKIGSNFHPEGEGEVLAGGVTKDIIHDLENWWFQGGTDEHLFVAEKNDYAASKIRSKSTFFNSNNFPDYDNGLRDYYIGPEVKIWSEGITLEDLTHAQGNVREVKHTIVDEIVAVAVKNIDYKDYLICRSKEELQNPAYRQAMKPGQESFVDENGNPYPWSDPNTPQYAWVILDIDNPNSYIIDAENHVGKTLTGVRGTYCEYNQTREHLKWINPILKIEGTPTVTGQASTTLNTYPLTNFVQPKDNHFLLKPVLGEMCDVVDVMRSHGDHWIYVPDENAIMPEVKQGDQYVAKDNFYVENGISYGQDYSFASFLDNNEADKAYRESDMELLNGQTYLNWRLYDKVYDFPNSLVIATEHADKPSYVYPLDMPNAEHTMSAERMVMHIIGAGKLQKYETDMFVGNDDYWSRYKYGENRNAYRNDIAFSFSKPNVDKCMGTLSVWRCNDKGEKLAKVGELIHNQWDFNRFVVNTLDAAKEAANDEELRQIEKAPYFPANQDYTLGSKVGDNYVTTMYMSDMFYSTTMQDKDENTNLSKDYQYRLETEVNGITTVVGYAPVYKTDENVVTRAHYTQAEVDGDVENTLDAEDKATITFTPNDSKALTEYRVYKGRHNAQAADSHTTIAKSVIEIDDRGFLNPAVEEELGETVMEFVPEVYTAYNDNTYGCYKQEVTNASIAVEASALQASQLTTTDGYKYFHVELDITSLLMAVDKDTRYLVRLWREDADGTITLLNTASNFDEDHVLELNPEWETNYDELNTTTGKAEEFAYTISDTFKARVGSAPAGMRRAGGDEVYGCNYYATLYVKDDATGKFYVKKQEIPVSWSKSVATAIDDVNAVGAQVASVRYIGVNGVESDKPFQGVNVVVTTYTDGTRTTAKVVK